MRTNKKDSLLAIALSIVESDGLAALTYDSLSIASGISKSGLIYHFPSRHQLLLDLNTAAAQTWTQALEAAAGGPASEVPLRQRMHALLEVESHSATRADLLLSIDANLHEDIRSIWEKALAPGLCLTILTRSSCSLLRMVFGYMTTSMPDRSPQNNGKQLWMRLNYCYENCLMK
ncbi:hypothetical protein CPTB_01403 [Corynebacterium pseudotuberculosis]|nr:hypothetical protein CPTB_01403 [Corynebacterium pseudotuberculosis]